MAAATSSALTSLPIGWRALSAARSAAGSGAASSSCSYPRRPGGARVHVVHQDALGHVIGCDGQRERVTRLGRAVEGARCGRPLWAARSSRRRRSRPDRALLRRWAQQRQAAWVVRTTPNMFNVEHLAPLFVVVVFDGSWPRRCWSSVTTMLPLRIARACFWRRRPESSHRRSRRRRPGKVGWFPARPRTPSSWSRTATGAVGGESGPWRG